MNNLPFSGTCFVGVDRVFNCLMGDRNSRVPPTPLDVEKSLKSFRLGDCTRKWCGGGTLPLEDLTF